MIEKTLRRLEERIRESAASPADAEALMDLVRELRAELPEMEPGLAEKARSAAAAAAGEAQDVLDDRFLDLERSHPRVAAALRSLMQTLSDAGI